MSRLAPLAAPLEDVGAASVDQPVRSLALALPASPSQAKVASGECCVSPLRRCNSAVGWLVGGGVWELVGGVCVCVGGVASFSLK